MNLLRRWFRGRADDAPAAPDDAANEPAAAADLEALERDHELEMTRAEQERLDELQQRQLRYASYAWQPPPQGGERRADDSQDQPAS